MVMLATGRRLHQFVSNRSVEEYIGITIGDDVFLIFELVFSDFTFGILAVIGVLSNALNMIIFVQQSLKDSMTVGLFTLSITDFAISVIEIAISMTYFLNYMLPDSLVDLWALAYVAFGWSLYAGYLISCWITAIVSAERCFCVVSPFKVKRVFTRTNCVITIIIIYIMCIVTILPVYIVETMQWLLINSTDPCANITVPEKWFYTVLFSDFSDAVETAVDAAAGMFLFLVSQTILIICSIWMTYSLKASSSVRSNRLLMDKDSSKLSATRSRLTEHEKKLIRMVLMLSMLQTAYNIPRLTLTLFYSAYPGISSGDKKFSTMIWTVAAFFNHISCTTNTCCYYFHNSNYRRFFRKIFRMRSL